MLNRIEAVREARGGNRILDMKNKSERSMRWFYFQETARKNKRDSFSHAPKYMYQTASRRRKPGESEKEHRSMSSSLAFPVRKACVSISSEKLRPRKAAFLTTK